MKLQTQVVVSKTPGKPISYQSKVLMMGSCFVEHIGDKLDFYHFQVLQNPFGIIFHPEAFFLIIERALSNQLFTIDDVFESDRGVWSSYYAHSNLNQLNPDALLDVLNSKLSALKTSIQEGTHMVFSYGTAWGYRLKSSHQLVANCHKQPQNRFQKTLQSVEDTKKIIEKTVQLIRNINPDIEMIFTVSPIRHTKDGIVENSLSKAHLLTAVHSNNIEFKGLHYFPSYEILIDQLRDYRFYEDDMIHPSNLAVNIIWNTFKAAWLDDSSFDLMYKIEGIEKRLNHKPFQPNSEAHIKFAESLNQEISELQAQYPFVSFKR